MEVAYLDLVGEGYMGSMQLHVVPISGAKGAVHGDYLHSLMTKSWVLIFFL
jgi:hypothetical protein